MISIDGLSVTQGAFSLQNVSLRVPLGKYGVLMGKTGCGKSTLLEIIAGLRSAQQGTIRLGNRDVTRLEPHERGLGYVPQDAALFRTMTVADHLGFALKLRHESSTAIRERVEELAGWLGITHLLKRRPSRLSGGEAQRVAIGRALSFRPAHLLLDEPLSSLDEATRDALVELLNGLRNSGKVTVLHVTHNRSEAERLGDLVFQLSEGKISL